MQPTLIFISHLGLQHSQKPKNSKRVGYIDCVYYNRMTLMLKVPVFFPVIFQVAKFSVTS